MKLLHHGLGLVSCIDDLPILSYHLYQPMLWNIIMDTLLLNAMGAEIEIVPIADVATVV